MKRSGIGKAGLTLAMSVMLMGLSLTPGSSLILKNSTSFPVAFAESKTLNLPLLAPENLASYQRAIQTYITDWISEYYSRYYRVNYVEATVENLQAGDGRKIIALAQVHLNKTLKIKKVDELPFIRGMLMAMGITNYNYEARWDQKVNAILATHPGLTAEQAKEAVKVLDEKYQELASYIGVADDSYMTLKMEAEFRHNACEDVKLYLQQQDGYVSAEQILPSSPEEMEKDGFTAGASLVIPHSVNYPSLYPGYDRIKARDYANAWTSNSTELCPHGLAYRTISYWNNSKWPYFTNACHADCADYISQALNAGGIPVDPGQWDRLNDGGNGWAWTSVPGLKNYMINQKGYWRASTWASASAGGVIVIPNYHVMMIVKNDTVERLYSAHTNDKKQCPYSNHSDWEYYILW